MKKLSEIQDWQEMIGDVINCDCLEGMKLIPDKSVDLILTDPPYGISMDKGFGGFDGFGGLGTPIARRKYDDCWDKTTPSQEVFDTILEKSKISIIFGGNFFANMLPNGGHWLVWDKLNTMPTFGDCELAWTNIKRNSVKKYTLQYNGLIGKEVNRQHPTQKPLELMRWIIVNYSNEGDLILDPFMGSGTTLRACKDLNRRYIGMELSKKYCKVADDRLKQQNLF